MKLASRPPIERMSLIARLLQRDGAFSAQAVAERLEVNLETVERDIHFMRDRLGYELKYVHQKRQWVGQPPQERIL